MFGKTKTDPSANPNADAAPAKDSVPGPVEQFQRLAVAQSATQGSSAAVSTIGSDVIVVGKVCGEGTIRVQGRVEGELRASTVIIADGAQVEGDVIAEDLTIGGRVKGTVHADRVKLTGTAMVQGDIFHRSLSIEENARFEGSSRREDHTVEQRVGIQAERAPAAVVAYDAGRKLNGDHPGILGHAVPAAE